MMEFTEAEEKVIQGWESFSGESFDDLFWKDKRDFAVKILGLSEEQARDKIHHGRLLSDIIDIQDGVVVVAGQMIGDFWGRYFDDLDRIAKKAYMFGNNTYCAELELDERYFKECTMFLDSSTFDEDWISEIRIELSFDGCSCEIEDYLLGLEKELINSGWFEVGYKNMYGDVCDWPDAQVKLHNSMMNVVAYWKDDGYVLIDFEQTFRDETPDSETVIYKNINKMADRSKSLSISD